MDNNSIQGSITINATPSKLWDVLTNPEKIVLYTGSMAQTDWSQGSPITWSGEMHGTKFQNKGQVLENMAGSQLRYTYWSGMGGDADLPENYSEITWALDPLGADQVELTYARIRIPTNLETQIFQEHLSSMLAEIKKLAEE
jgi:uncharacterized protein YndB with AHSA1/START domain